MPGLENLKKQAKQNCVGIAGSSIPWPGSHFDIFRRSRTCDPVGEAARVVRCPPDESSLVITAVVSGLESEQP